MPKSTSCPQVELASQSASTTATTSKSTRSYGQGSTGPRTPSGKIAIANNNLRHGLLSTRNVLPGENAVEFEGFRDALVRDLAPVGAVEDMLVERIVSAAWRLRRAVRIETEILELADEPRRLKAYVGPDVLSLTNPGPTHPPEHQLGVAFARGAASVMDRLSRYEVTLERSLHRNLHELERLQTRRAGGVPVPTPIAIDVDVDVRHGNFEWQKTDSEAECTDHEAPLDLVDELRNGFASMRVR